MTFHHERRLQRALYHLESFEAERSAWLHENPHRTWTELDVQSGKKVIWAEVLKPPPDSLSLIAGDCIHNLRASLDNLAFELALRHTKGQLSSDIETKSGFPILSTDIAKDPESLKKFNRMTRGIDPLAKAELERVQPYTRENRFRSHPLWQLNKLSVEEKHRLPHTATLNNLSTLSFFVPDNISADDVKILLGFFDSSAPIAEYPAFDSTGAEVNMYFTTAFDVCFAGRAPKQLWGNSIADTLRIIYRFIANHVLPPLHDFLVT